MRADGGPVTPDGSPVDVYLALPLEPEFTPLLSALRARSSVLDLGCGVGRLATHLHARGVVLASHFVNVADLDQRRDLLETVARHIAPSGSAFIERYDPT